MRPFTGCVRIARRDGMQIIFSLSQAFFTINSVHRGLGGGRKIPSGALDTFSFVPNTPM
jgi:hypothetical protein